MVFTAFLVLAGLRIAGFQTPPSQLVHTNRYEARFVRPVIGNATYKLILNFLFSCYFSNACSESQGMQRFVCPEPQRLGRTEDHVFIRPSRLWKCLEAIWMSRSQNLYLKMLMVPCRASRKFRFWDSLATLDSRARVMACVSGNNAI